LHWQGKYYGEIVAEGNWQEEYQRKLIAPDEAARLVKSGDSVACTTGRDPLAIGLALAARKEELEGVKLFLPTPTFDFGWYDRGWEDSFSIQIGYNFPRGVAAECLAERRADYVVGGLLLWMELPETKQVDVLLTEISPPDENGFCSFGASLYDKRRWIAHAKLVIAEVNDRLIRTYGDNFVHVSQIDYFVEHPHSGRKPGAVTLAGQPIKEVPPETKRIAEYVSTLINSGDTLQIGQGGTSEGLVRAGLLEGKEDLGWHSEVTPGGIIRFVRERLITGKHKTIDRGKAVATAIGGGAEEDMAFVHMNPLFELRDIEYTHHPAVICSLDNMVAINNALEVDLTGQVGAESMGYQIFSGAGGLLTFAVGANLSRGGRFVIVLPSTARGGTVSRIVPMLKEGTVVTVPRILADSVVTEYGIARLKGKSQRERAEELIAIAHPDFRGELRTAAQRIYWP
jgi:4-hydroxybutyrate CoA-transferase